MIDTTIITNECTGRHAVRYDAEYVRQLARNNGLGEIDDDVVAAVTKELSSVAERMGWQKRLDKAALIMMNPPDEGTSAPTESPAQRETSEAEQRTTTAQEESPKTDATRPSLPKRMQLGPPSRSRKPNGRTQAGPPKPAANSQPIPDQKGTAKEGAAKRVGVDVGQQNKPRAGGPIDGVPRLKVAVHTDGACRGNPGPGGWCAILMRDGREPEILRGNDADTTNNRMEMMAVLRALEAVGPECNVDVFTDSQYVSNAFNQGWAAKWQRNGWKSASGPVLNQNLWLPLVELAKGDGERRCNFRWVRGHSGDPMNEEADRIAVREAIKAQRGCTEPDDVNTLAIKAAEHWG